MGGLGRRPGHIPANRTLGSRLWGLRNGLAARGGAALGAAGARAPLDVANL